MSIRSHIVTQGRNENSTCVYFPTCQGCSHWHISYQEQINQKINQLSNIFKMHGLKHPPIDFISCGESALRTRVDFTIQKLTPGQQVMGFYNKQKELLDINTCLQLMPALQNFYSEFQKIQFPIKKGSARLRVGPSGLKGCWLDFSNLDIKKLLDDPVFFNQFIEHNIEVEVGQKGKRVIRSNAGYKLADPIPMAWFETYDQNLKPLPLKGLVSDFTQPSWLTAQTMTSLLLEWTANLTEGASVIEFGPGLGQFTIPLLTKGFKVSVYESNSKATEALQLNAKELNLAAHLQIQLGDFQNAAVAAKVTPELVLVNPPRSGLKKFTYELIKTQSKKCIYISCFPESMANDLALLTAAGYTIQDLKIVDQFPQTSHYETCVLLEKII